MRNLNKILHYLQVRGWTSEYVIFYNIIAEIEKTKEYSKLLNIIKKPNTLLIQNFIFKYKHLTTDKNNYYDDIKLFNCFAAVDSAMGKL